MWDYQISKWVGEPPPEGRPIEEYGDGIEDFAVTLGGAVVMLIDCGNYLPTTPGRFIILERARSWVDERAAGWSAGSAPTSNTSKTPRRSYR